MKQEILSNKSDAVQLERLYRTDKTAFRQAFQTLKADLSDTTLAAYWDARLNFRNEATAPGEKKDLIFLIAASIFAGLIAKLPALLNIDKEFFYTRNAGFIVLPALTVYFGWKNGLTLLKTTVIGIIMLTGLLFINTLPDNNKSDVINLACIHVPIMLWSVLGFAFAGNWKDSSKRLGYLQYCGDLIVISALLGITSFLLSGITIGLFSLIGLKIEEFYFNNVVLFGLPAIPIIGTYLIRTYPALVGKVSPTIARIFAPLVLVMLTIYLGAMVYTHKDPFNDREFLVVFNVLLAGVMAIIFFSIAEATDHPVERLQTGILLLLSALTIVVNGIALSAIIFRISAWGITPNRAAVLGSNILMLANLVLVAIAMLRIFTKRTEMSAVATIIARYLPLYALWAAIVTFLFTVVFGVR